MNELQQSFPQFPVTGGFDKATGEIFTEMPKAEILVQDTPNYAIYQLPNGKFEKRMKYQEFGSYKPQTVEEQIELFGIMNEESHPLVTPMRQAIRSTITIEHVFFKPYESFNEDTGSSDHGVTCTLKSDDGRYYVTSSKSVYYTLQNIFKTFGTPGSEGYRPVIVEVTATKREQGEQINLKLLGIKR